MFNYLDGGKLCIAAMYVYLYLSRVSSNVQLIMIHDLMIFKRFDYYDDVGC
jgi:hypothetical protein